ADLQYEIATSRHQSFAIGIGYTPKVGLPFKDALLDQFDGNDDARRAIESTEFTKFTITPEYRFYFGKKGAPIGFYIAPFARYTHMSFDQQYKYTPSNNVPHEANIKGKFSGIGGGIGFGTQFALGKHMTFDWYIVGPFVGAMKANFDGTDDMSDLSDHDKADLERDIEDVDLPLWTIDATVGNNTINAKLKGPFVGIRAFGLSLGYRF
ncbi:MAG: DUF3575 domain-containing protein, partial [Chitinophagaceae bacterium]|nr:DUF3575 domain-containing protein [Chitinophagaceae bacterium]